VNRYRLIISSFAEDDLQVSKEWYDLQKELLGEKFINEIDKTLQIILLNPFQFPKIKGEIRRAIIQKFPFGIFFFVEKDNINVIAIFHFSRNPKLWKDRLKGEK
jgi:plasmid stabilization system protein ParE